jgi:hypothetical protein
MKRYGLTLTYRNEFIPRASEFLKDCSKKKQFFTLLSRRELDSRTHGTYCGLVSHFRRVERPLPQDFELLPELWSKNFILPPTANSALEPHSLLKMAQLRQEDLRALEQTRQRLYQLSQSIGSLKTDIMRTSPMPAWYGSILSYTDSSLLEYMLQVVRRLQHIQT